VSIAVQTNQSATERSWAATRRAPDRLQRDQYDLIVVGGGVYGACITLEAARRGLRPLLLEKEDFGGGTSSNSLRILHGGLRYLQGLDLGRFRESVRERRWWMRSFPGLVRPLPCMLPLYGQGMHRPFVLRSALWLNDALSWDRNRRVPAERRLPPGRIMDPTETRRRFPLVDPKGLQGAALWYDAWMLSPHRLIMEVLRRATAHGGAVLNYVTVTNVLEAGGRVRGVIARDEVAGVELEFSSAAVVNAAGPSAPDLAGSIGGRNQALFRPSLAFNLLLDQPPPADAAVAVRPPEPGAPVYFVCPYRGRTLVGTGHAPWPAGEPVPARVPDELVAGFLAQLERAIPGYGAASGTVTRHLVGLLPVRSAGTIRLARRPTVLDHGRRAGPGGLISVSGVKFTTAPAVARTVMGRLQAGDGDSREAEIREEDPPVRPWRPFDEFMRFAYQDPDAARSLVTDIVKEESVVYMDDLIIRRLDWGLEVEEMSEGVRAIEALLGSDCPPPLPVR
jgi:glycerol-3-phosphate dehydrogenase